MARRVAGQELGAAVRARASHQLGRSALFLLAASLSMAAARNEHVIAAYKPLQLHPEIFDAAAGWRRWIDPALLDALDTKNASALQALLREEVVGVHSFALFNDEFCKKFLEELDNYRSTGLPIDRPNSMNNYGIIVNNIGMHPVISQLQRTVLQPIANLLHPVAASTGRGFDSHHSFMVQYKAGEDLGLDMHTDDSDVTLNVCLGRNFTGAQLTVCGDSRTPNHRQFFINYVHVVGRCLVHLGSRRHGADNIHEGERNNLIIWNSNSAYRASSAYVNNQPYHREGAAPDPRCLSYTHDRDFGQFLDYPPGKTEHRGGGWCPPAHACYDRMAPQLSGRRYHDEV